MVLQTSEGQHIQVHAVKIFFRFKINNVTVELMSSGRSFQLETLMS
jgi:hypothetical protein